MLNNTSLPKVNHKYKDDCGITITVTDIDERRVEFMREGYPYPCIRPLYNFLSKFRAVNDIDDTD
ncbi:DUF4222 domain-containing protein [Escherichia coli]|uniref:DUF4222 domain-containing protein n=1 Tax=Escherichia coli TaxID=562 RepID=UPI00066605A6|nr:DUF4222 domain-containing protein [Escherichia coli]EGJ8836525.1 DUF4222 domain-containing protein [Salmonella enterica]EGO4308606.1 DUF4222 domain-containing protein [Escherichia coli]EKC8925770.1 DUF4222 domain-containing protein [Escherichia coli]